MSEFEIQQLQDNQQIINSMKGLHEGLTSVSQSVYEIQDLKQQVSHLSDQLDLSHQTVYTLGQYVSTLTVVTILCAACLMFLIGHKVVKG